jgi:energy-coupling factor transporter ATP-binding protein EcfA2
MSLPGDHRRVRLTAARNVAARLLVSEPSTASQGGYTMGATQEVNEDLVADADLDGEQKSIGAETKAPGPSESEGALVAGVLDTESSELKLDAVVVKNFKKIVNSRLELGPITYLVGGNNSGKSSILQAIHTAVSCAQASVEAGQQVVAEASLRYSPVADFSLLGNGAPYDNNKATGHRGSVTFEGVANDGESSGEYRIEMYKGKNHYNVGVERTGLSPGFGQVISDPTKLFSVYVPGLAGVPHREEMSGYAAVFRKAASGDANLVFRNIIRLLNDDGNLPALEELLSDVLETPIAFRITYDSRRDLYVDVRLAAGDKPDTRDYLPVDLWGTGLLQITQIFAYVLLFRPAILLVDEPDSHLHPSRQKSLARALEEVSDRFGCKVVVATHSRHLITGASDSVKVVWMRNGSIVSSEQRELATLLMEIGALDQFDKNTPKVVICTEDEKPDAMKRALATLGAISDGVTVASFNGVENSQSAEAFKSMAELMDPPPRLIIHRDRDFLTTAEIADWSSVPLARGLEVFVTARCDIESYHTTPEHIALAAGVSMDEAKEVRDGVIAAQSAPLREKLFGKRRKANKAYLDGGAPLTDSMWPVGGEPPEEFLYGKHLLTQLNVKLRKMGKLKQQQSLLDTVSNEFADDLRRALEGDPAGAAP